jgi:hypothetical protein
VEIRGGRHGISRDDDSPAHAKLPKQADDDDDDVERAADARECAGL